MMDHDDSFAIAVRAHVMQYSIARRRHERGAVFYLPALHHHATMYDMKRTQAILCVLMAMFFAATLAVPSLAFLYVPRQPAPILFATSLDMVPADGIPRIFRVYAKDRDAWVRQFDRVCGRCFLLRQGEKVQAFLPISSLGTSVIYNADVDAFEDMCFGVQYDLNGAVRRENDRRFMRSLQAIPVKIDVNGIICLDGITS